MTDWRSGEDILASELAGAVCALFAGGSALGAKLARILVRSGFPNMILIDVPGRRLQELNIAPHPCGYSALGSFTPKDMAGRLHRANAECHIEAIEVDIIRHGGQLSQLLIEKGVTEAHVTTADEPCRQAFNKAAIQAGLPTTFYGGAFDDCMGGEVMKVFRGNACYACLARGIDRRRVSGALPGKALADLLPDKADIRATRFANLAINQMAILEARESSWTMIARERPKDPEHNYVVYGNGEGLESPDFFSDIVLTNIPRDPNCPVCGNADGRQDG